MSTTDQPDIAKDVWDKLTAPFGEDEVELKPQPIRRDDRDYFQCTEGGPQAEKASQDGLYCGGRHARAIHLRYIGHAGITTRLNEVVSPAGWDWRPVNPADYPGLAAGGGLGMWIELDILGVRKLGFGDPGTSKGANAVKETIGDALRNAAMRFGVGTYLWSKSEKARAAVTFDEPQERREQQDRDAHQGQNRSEQRQERPQGAQQSQQQDEQPQRTQQAAQGHAPGPVQAMAEARKAVIRWRPQWAEDPRPINLLLGQNRRDPGNGIPITTATAQQADWDWLRKHAEDAWAEEEAERLAAEQASDDQHDQAQEALQQGLGAEPTDDTAEPSQEAPQ